MEIFFGEVSEQKELPPTIATDVTSKSCENKSGEWNKNIKKNILRKCLISFLILISLTYYKINDIKRDLLPVFIDLLLVLIHIFSYLNKAVKIK